MPSPTYITGTVTVTNANATVAGAGTSWALEGLEGGLFCCNGVSIPIASVTDDDTMVLDLVWPGSTLAGQAYSIWKLTGQASLSMEAYERIAGVSRRLEANSYIDADVYGTTAQKSSFDAAPKDFKFLDTSVSPFALWVKASDTSGDWDGPNAFGQGTTGSQGDKGWAPVYALVSDGARRVKQLVDYVGGAGTKPTANIGEYVGASGYTAVLANGVDVRGQTGSLSGLTTFWQDRTTLDSTRPVSWSNLADDPVERVPYPPAFDMRLTDPNALLPEWFSRASTGTYFDALGIMRTAAAGVPRLDRNPVTGAMRGLLIEGARTNLLLRSQELDNASWTKTRATISANAIAAPDGTTTADKLVEDSSVTTTHFATQAYTFSTTTYSATVFARAGERSWLLLRCAHAGDSGAYFNVSTGALGATFGTIISKSIEAMGGGWYRCQVVFAATAGTNFVGVYLASADGTIAYTGDGTSGLYPWGFQLEAAAWPSSYIPTTSAAVTRAADIPLIDLSAFAFNHGLPGTIFVESSIDRVSAAVVDALLIDDASTANRFEMYVSSDNSMRAIIATASVTQSDISGGAVAAAGTVRRQAMAWAANDIAHSGNGAAVTTDASATLPTVTKLRLGQRSGTGTELFGYVSRVIYWPRRLTNAELALLTAA